jgi:hypothetical protein
MIYKNDSPCTIEPLQSLSRGYLIANIFFGINHLWGLSWSCNHLWSCDFVCVTRWFSHSCVLCSQLCKQLAKFICACGMKKKCVCATHMGHVCCHIRMSPKSWHDYFMIFFIHLVLLHDFSGTEQHFVVELFKSWFLDYHFIVLNNWHFQVQVFVL